MWPYPWTHVGTPSQLGHMDRVAATMPSQAHAGAAQEAPDIGQLEGQDVPLVRPSSCTVKGGIPSSRRYVPTCASGQRNIYRKWQKMAKNAHTHGGGTWSTCQTWTGVCRRIGTKSYVSNRLFEHSPNRPGVGTGRVAK